MVTTWPLGSVKFDELTVETEASGGIWASTL